MPFNGAGTYTRPAGQPVTAGQDILDTTFNTYTADVATALTNCITRDGQSQATANIPMGGNKITGLAAGAVAGDAARYEQIGDLAITQIHAATPKVSIVDADEVAILDSATSFSKTTNTFTKIKAFLKTYFDTLYDAAGAAAAAIVTAASDATTKANAAQAAAIAAGFGQGQTRQDVTASRALLTNYSNATSKPIYISVTCTIAGASTAILTVGGIAVAKKYAPSTLTDTFSHVVLPGEAYSLQATAISANGWIEVR